MGRLRVDPVGGQNDGTNAVDHLGVFGGTFDPIHLGHLIAAEESCRTLELSEVRFVPAADPPHKPAAVATSAEHRLRMVQLAVAGNPTFTVGRTDIDRSGPHYTVDLLQAIRTELGRDAAQLHFIMGADSLADLLTWRDPERLIELARLAVVCRPGFEPDMIELKKRMPRLADRVDFVTMPLIGISATDIRGRVASGRSIKYLVPDGVAQYIADGSLYLRPRADAP